MSVSVRVGQTLPDTQNQEAPLGSVYVPELSVDKLTSGQITAATIEIGDDGRLVIGTTTRIELNQLGLYATKDGQPIFKLDKDGLEITGKVNSIDGTFSGRLQGADIAGSSIVGSTIQGGTIAIGNGNSVFLATGLGISVGSGTFLGAPFRVSADGALTATNATLSGSITGSSIVGSTISAGENGTFTVNALGQMTAKDATITGTIRTAVTGPRIVMSHNGQLDGGVGQLTFYTGVSGETPAGIYATNQSGAGYKKIFSMTTGRDGATGYAGPALIMTVADAPAGGQEARVNFEFDQLYLNGTVSIAGNVYQPVTFTNTSVFANYSPAAGNGNLFEQIRYYKDVHGNVVVSGFANCNAQVAGGSTLFTLPVGFRPKRTMLRQVSYNDTEVRRVDIYTDGTVKNVGANATWASGAYVGFSIRFPTYDF